MLRALNALPVGQQVPVRADRLGGLSRGPGRGGVLFPGGESLDVVGAADELAADDGLVQDGDGAVGLADGHQGAAETDLGRDGVRVIGPEHARRGRQGPAGTTKRPRLACPAAMSASPR